MYKLSLWYTSRTGLLFSNREMRSFDVRMFHLAIKLNRDLFERTSQDPPNVYVLP